MDFRFTLKHNNNGVIRSQQISQPDGWKGAKITLERDLEFYSLIEHYEGAANGSLIFYGADATDDGGIDLLKDVEQTFGFNANLELEVDFSLDDVNYIDLFNGLLNLLGKQEMPNNKMAVPVVRDDFWNKFITHFDTPVNLSSNVDINGNAVDPVTPVTINLTPQKVRTKYEGHQGVDNIQYVIPDNQYGQIDFEDESVSEIESKLQMPRVINSVRPSGLFEIEFSGTYLFDINMVTSTTPDAVLGFTTDPNLDVRLQINDNAAITLTKTNQGVDGSNGSTLHEYTGTQTLEKGDTIRLYFYNNNATGASYTFYWVSNLGGDFSNLTITADTIYPETEAQGYLLHDAFFGVCERLGLGDDSFYSEFLGSTSTNMRQYADDGCGWMYVILKGLQIRGYTLSEKPFFTSFKQLWDGANPILNLGLSYDRTNTSPASQVIRIEQKSYYFNATPSINFSNVQDIGSSYDREHIFKSVRVGYKKWQSENAPGIDDPQTTHTYATILDKVGTKTEGSANSLNIESDFIAAGLAIETTRRKAIEKNADYKYDNDTFIIALKENDVSPDVYAPELNENFNSVTNLINSDTRYNLILTPLRNFLRWANFVGGCLQKYTTSSYRFVSGEGNYDMISDYSCTSGNQCQAIICDSLAENGNISLSTYNSTFGYLFYPMLYEINIPMEWEDFDTIRDNPRRAIGVSQTDANHKPFFIKKLDYDIVKAEATIIAWPREYFNIQVIQGDYYNPGCPVERTLVSSDDEGSTPPVNYSAEYLAILNYANSQGYIVPTEAQRLIQNQFLIDLKDAGIWDDLDLLYVFATDGDRNFAKINWKNPGTNNAAEVNTPTFTENLGFTGDGSTSYLNTGWDPTNNGVNFTLDECGAFCYINNEITITAADEFAFGCFEGGLAQGVALHPKIQSGGGQHAFTMNANAINGVGSGVSSIGLFHIRRVADNDSRLFKNGSQVGATQTTASSSLTDSDMFILTSNVNGSPFRHTDSQVGIFGIGASLTGKEATLYNIWNDYFNNL